MAYPLINPTPQFFDSSGSPLASGTIEFRNPTTNDLINSYPTADDADAQTNANDNPLTLNSRGEAANGLYLEDGVKYKVILKDADGATVWTQDDVLSPDTFAFITPTGLTGDGTTDDATDIQAALDSTSTKKIVFTKATYGFASQITIPAGLDVDFNGSTLSKTVSDDGTENYQIVVGANAIVRNLTLSIPSGIQINNGISLTDGAELHNVKVVGVDQQSNLGNGGIRAGILVDGTKIILDHVGVEKIDKAIRVEDSSADIRMNDILVTTYVTGINIHNTQRLVLTNYFCHTASANATGGSGHDGIVAEDCVDSQFSNIRIDNASEHGIYVSASGSYLTFNNFEITNSGKTGFKCSGGTVSGRMKYIIINGLYVDDCSTGSSPGTNEEGLLLEYCDYVTVDGYSVQEISSKAFRGIYILDSTNVTINGAVIRSTSSHGIVITDKNVTSGVAATSALTNIIINSPKILSPGGSGIYLDIGDGSTTVSGIHINNVFVGSPGAYGATLDLVGGNVTGPIIINGHVRNATSGVLNNVNSVGDEELNIDLKNSESREIVTGTVTLSVYSPHSVLNSSGGAVTATLPSGARVGQRKVITMSEASNPSTVSVTNHTTSSPEVFTFNATTDRLVLSWDGTTWFTESNVGVAT